MSTGRIWDVVVVGAGVFGVWTAWHLQRAGCRVLIVDAYGAGNNRSSSGGESRIIRCIYGEKDIYSRWSLESLDYWKELSARDAQPLFYRTGVIWLIKAGNPFLTQSLRVIEQVGVPHEFLNAGQLSDRYPQIQFQEEYAAIYEPESGALMARRSVQKLWRELLEGGAEYLQESVLPLTSETHGAGLNELKTKSGKILSAESYVLACGPWLGRIAPDVLKERIKPTRQEIFFFGIEAGDPRFSPPAMPTWADEEFDYYGMPDLEGRGFKIGFHKRGPRIDPDTEDRQITPSILAGARAYLAQRFPALKDAPLIEARVCQYENTSNHDFLIDRYPGLENVWLVGGGSGHGFKHGPALGRYVAARVTGDEVQIEPQFSLETKGFIDAQNL
jgi:monomeric sarcosine oxidase